MQLTLATFTVNKRFPLTISRGTTAQTTNIWVKIEADGWEGWGEASPFSIVREGKKSTETLLEDFKTISPLLQSFHPLERQKIETILDRHRVNSSIRAAIDMALYDWLGKSIALPLWRLWGLDRSKIVPTSVTIGINSAEGAKQRVKDWQQLMNAGVLKLKLGSPQGIEADKQMVLAVKEQAPSAQLTVDANGGWTLDEAIAMCNWLQNFDVKYVEQPLPVGQENNLPRLRHLSPLPIFVDESCFTSQDITKLADRVDGVNLKIMKTGGLTETIRAIHLAKACGLQIMFGCYSDSSLANTAMSHLAPLADYLDLDSHLNLIDDPFQGAILRQGILLPNDLPGLGVTSENRT